MKSHSVISSGVWGQPGTWMNMACRIELMHGWIQWRGSGYVWGQVVMLDYIHRVTLHTNPACKPTPCHSSGLGDKNIEHC